MFSNQEIRQALVATGGDVRATAELLAMAPRPASEAFGDDSGRPQKQRWLESESESDDDEEPELLLGFPKYVSGVYIPNDDGLAMEQMTTEEFKLEVWKTGGDFDTLNTSHREYQFARDPVTGFRPSKLSMARWRSRDPQALNTRATKLMGYQVIGPAFLLKAPNWPLDPQYDLPITVDEVRRLLLETPSEE